MNTDRELMQQALGALEFYYDQHGEESDAKVITALRERLAQPVQEPYGYFQLDLRLDAWVQNRDSNKGVAFYTTPPQRKPLSDEDMKLLWAKHGYKSAMCKPFARAIEAAHGIKGKA